MSADSHDRTHANDPPHVECDDVWKVFGRAPAPAIEALRRGMSKEEVRSRYDCVAAVAGVSLRIPRGEMLCVMGLSGSGKSTLLRMINRLIEPTGGSVRIDGHDVATFDGAALRQLRSQKIGMVFQHMALWPHRTIRDNVAYSLEVRGVPKEQRYDAASRALDEVMLSGWEHQYPDELSGGMQQRVGLARALVADPDILLMDEPFSALDPIIRSELQDYFAAFSAKVRKTTVFITHDLEEAVKIGHRVAIMNEGRIEQIGTPVEILARPANDYVRRFVRGISQLRQLRAIRMVDQARPPEPRAGATDALDPEADLKTVLTRLAAHGEVFVRAGGDGVARITMHSALESIRDCLG